MTIHAAAGGILRAPELPLADEEAKSLAQSLVELERAFPTQVDPRAFAVLNFVGVAGMVYVPRALAIRMRLAMEADERRKNRQSETVNLAAPSDHGFSTSTFNPKPN